MWPIAAHRIGREHEEANRGEYGRADVWDIVAAGFDWKQRAGENRLLIVAGYSYGGFLTFLSLAQDENPWAGGIALWSVSGIHRLPLHQQRAFPTDPDQQAAACVQRAPLTRPGAYGFHCSFFTALWIQPRPPQKWKQFKTAF